MLARPEAGISEAAGAPFCVLRPKLDGADVQVLHVEDSTTHNRMASIIYVKMKSPAWTLKTEDTEACISKTRERVATRSGSRGADGANLAASPASGPYVSTGNTGLPQAGPTAVLSEGSRSSTELRRVAAGLALPRARNGSTL